MKRFLVALPLLALALTACNTIPASAYKTPGQPESLIDRSGENVSIPLASEANLQDVIDWVQRDKPQRVEVSCTPDAELCTRVHKTLDAYNLPFEVVNPNAQSTQVTLIYDRVVLRDCNHRYVSDHNNPHNLNYNGFGCSNAVNMLQMVSDHEQFINPALSDLPDAERADKVFGNYLETGKAKAKK